MCGDISLLFWFAFLGCSDVEHIFMYLLTIYMSSLKKCQFRSNANFFLIWLFIYLFIFILSCKSLWQEAWRLPHAFPQVLREAITWGNGAAGGGARSAGCEDKLPLCSVAITTMLSEVEAALSVAWSRSSEIRAQTDSSSSVWVYPSGGESWHKWDPRADRGEMSCLLRYPWPFRSDSAWAASPLCLSLLIPSPCFHHAWPVMKALCRAGGRTGRLAVVERLLRYCLSKRQPRPLCPGVPSPPLVPALLPQPSGQSFHRRSRGWTALAVALCAPFPRQVSPFQSLLWAPSQAH